MKQRCPRRNETANIESERRKTLCFPLLKRLFCFPQRVAMARYNIVGVQRNAMVCGERERPTRGLTRERAGQANVFALQSPKVYFLCTTNRL